MSVIEYLLSAFNNTGALVQYRWDEGHWGPGMMGWGMMGWVGGIMMIILWIVIIISIVVFVRWLMSFGKVKNLNHEEKETAMDVLKKRYAKGEINKEEFEQKKKDIS